jgi:arylformamidase
MDADRVIDISRTISGDALVYPGDPPLAMEPLLSIRQGDPCNLTKLDWISHFLTHLDAPKHFLETGTGVDRIPLDACCGEAIVVEVEGEVVLPEDLPERGELLGRCVLFKTTNSKRWNPRRFLEDHVYLSGLTAISCAEAGVKLVGIDYLSPDRYGDEAYPVHRILLEAGIPILEGIDLVHVPPGRYRLFAFPLKIKEGDGSPVRAVLMPLL